MAGTLTFRESRSGNDMTTQEIKILPESVQLLVLELLRFCDEVKLLRQEVANLRRAITKETE